MESVVIRKFDMKSVADGSTVVLIGKRKTGKSFLIKDILYHKRKDLPTGVVISNTDHVADPPFFRKFIPPILIYKEYTSKILQTIYERQEKAQKERWKDYRFFIVMDDCISDASTWKKDKMIKRMFFEGRHFKILYILSTQDPMAISPGLRGNVDYIIIHRTNNKRVLQQIYENYAGFFDNLNQFKYFVEKCTRDNCVMVIDNQSNSTNLEDNIYFYKAEPHDDFKMFSQDLWDKSEKAYNKEKSTVSHGNAMVIDRKR